MLTPSLRNLIIKTAKINLRTSFLIQAKFSTKPETKIQNLQEASMNNEVLFCVDENDRVTRFATKRECHTVTKNGDIPLHRGFSVYLFNSHGDFLLTKRAATKITYPNLYTNTCCSHPVVGFKGEEEEKDALGVKIAAVRRLNAELGIPTDKLPLEKFTYLTRTHYKDLGDGQWGEHEIFYFLFLRGDFPLSPNSDEISEIRFVPREKFDEISTLKLTPWFHLVFKEKLKLWWNNLDNLDQFKDHENILQLGFDKK